MTTKITEQNISQLANAGVDWQSVITADGSTSTNATAGKGYFIDTTSNTHTINLPASPSLGDTVVISDIAGTFGTNNVTVGRNGSNINGSASDEILDNDDTQRTFVYSDSTNGWIDINSDNIAPEYISATGGTVSTSGNFKIHTFTGDGCFVVATAGNAGGNNQLEYVVVAGGGGGGGGDGTHGGGGGGAGGFRFAAPSLAPATYPAKPLAGSTLTATASSYPITVGGGGSGNSACTVNPGSNSVFSTITSTGGGGGANDNSTTVAAQADNGGSGGGAGADSGGGNTPLQPKGTGNTPPVSPPQGNPGETSNQSGYGGAGGGGGAIAPGVKGGPPDNPFGTGGSGGAGGGFPDAFGTSGQNCGSFYYFSGGGGGAPHRGQSTSDVPGGLGGGGTAGGNGAGTAGSANTGGGGGARSPCGSGGAGGKGIVIIRYQFQ